MSIVFVLLFCALATCVRNVIYAVLCLGISFFCVFSMFFLDGKEFFAIMCMLVYLGASIVLFLFAIMMERENKKILYWSISGIALLSATLIEQYLWFHKQYSGLISFDLLKVSKCLYDNFYLEALGLLLLSTLIGALFLKEKSFAHKPLSIKSGIRKVKILPTSNNDKD